MGALLVKEIKDIQGSDPTQPKKNGQTRIVCISDTHSQTDNEDFPAIPDGDILIHSGDFTNHGTHEDIQKFNAWLGTLPHQHKVVIAGNHDKTFDATFENNNEESAKEVQDMLTNATYLQDTLIELNNLKIFGSPWVPRHGHWGFLLNESQRLEKWSEIPEEIDVLITHGPPHGIGDLTDRDVHMGCKHLLAKVKEVKPKLHVYGHIHEAAGIRTDGATIFANAGTVAGGIGWHKRKIAFNQPIVIDL